MGVLSDLVSAPRDEIDAVIADDEPSAHWDGFSYRGLDNVKICTLLSLIRTGNPSAGFEAALETVEMVSGEEAADEGKVVFVIEKDDVNVLATVATLDTDGLASLAFHWGKTDELDDWSNGEVGELLQRIGDLAESAKLVGNCLLLWIAI